MEHGGKLSQNIFLIFSFKKKKQEARNDNFKHEFFFFINKKLKTINKMLLK